MDVFGPNDGVFSIGLDGTGFTEEVTLGGNQIYVFGGGELSAISFPEPEPEPEPNPVTGIEKEISGDVNIYPNPATHVINVRFSKTISSPVRVELLDIAGKSLNRSTLQGVVKDQVESFDIVAMSTGIYILKVSTSKGQVNTRVAIR